jgi:UDP-3-O-[3-hydroxymyristoyl] glucosamine N-acyltransferase
LSIGVPEQCNPAQEIDNISTLHEASERDITFFHHSNYEDSLRATQAGACLIKAAHEQLLPARTVALVVEDPYLSLAIILKQFYRIKNSIDTNKSFVSPKASIAKNATISEDCYISDFVTIEDNVVIKRGTFIGCNTTILQGVEIGEDCHIESNVTVSFAIIGNSAYIKSGARIGQQGFGFHMGRAGFVDVMQVGKVIIGDNVQIGANCTIDRGSINDTRIGHNVRIDNLVHIAHNVEIGDYCVIAAQTGIAGSASIGDACVFGGQVGVVGHVSIGNHVTVAAQSGVMRDTDAGSKVAGSPAINAVAWKRQHVMLKRIVDNRNTRS